MLRETVMILVAIFCIGLVIAIGGYLWIRADRRKKTILRSEKKVVDGDLVLRVDIEILRRAQSSLLPKALDLREEQTREYRHPESDR